MHQNSLQPVMHATLTLAALFAIQKTSKSAVLMLGYILALTTHAAVLEVGNEQPYQTACEAIRAAEPGDVIVLPDGTFSGACSWSTPGLTIRGRAAGAIVRVEAEGPTWQIAADDTVIENLTFSGENATEAGGAALELSGRNLTLRQVRIRGAAIGVRALELAGSTLTIEQSEISGNRTNVVAGRIDALNLIESNVHDATNGDSIDTQAVRNTFRNNRIGAKSSEGSRREVIIRDSQFTSITGNVVRRGEKGENGVVMQYLGTAAPAGEMDIAGNTFVSEAAGLVFVEAVGSAPPRARVEKNVFLGDGVLDAAFGTDLARSNFFGAAAELNSSEGGTAVPSDWGASAALLTDSTEGIPETTGSFKSSLLAPAIASLTLSDSTVVAGVYTKNNVVRLASAAPSGGVYVQLTTSNRAVAYPSSRTIYIPAGSISGAFVLMTNPGGSAGSALIMASASGSSKSASISIVNSVLKAITLEKAQIGSNGKLYNNRVYLSGPAPAGGMVVSLSASNGLVSIPTQVTVAAGVTSCVFELTARSVSTPQSVVITASNSTGRQTASLTVLPVAVDEMQILPATTAGGRLIGVKAWLNGPAPAGGLSILMSSSDPRTVAVPSVMTAAAGALYVAATVQTAPVHITQRVTLTATTGGTKKSGVVTVTSPGLYSVVSSVSVSARAQLTMTVKLDGPAMTSLPVSLRSTNPAVLAVPSTVTIPAGSSSASFVALSGAPVSSTKVTVSATAKAVTKTKEVTVIP